MLVQEQLAVQSSDCLGDRIFALVDNVGVDNITLGMQLSSDKGDLTRQQFRKGDGTEANRLDGSMGSKSGFELSEVALGH